MTESIKVGGDIISFCSRCQLSLAHILVSLGPDSLPAKVICKTCKAEHRHKVAKKASVKKAKTARKSKGTTSARKLKKEESVQMNLERWTRLVSEKTPIKYSVRTLFKQSDVVDHSSFGIGLVESLMEDDKINVLFRTESKVLVHNK